MPTVSFTAAQAANQIDRSVLQGLPGWVPATGSAVSLTYGFRSSATQSDFPLAADQMSGFQRFSSAEIQAANLAMQLWSDVANITLTRVGSGNSGEGAYTNSAQLLLGNWTTGAASTYASGWGTYQWSSSNGVTSRSSAVWIDGTKSIDTSPSAVNGGFQLIIHEIGHAIGLSHPGDYNVAPGVSISYAANAQYVQDSLQYTVMSYFSETNTGANYASLTPTTPMLHDIAAAQLMYGTNMTTRTGDTTYGFNSNADRSVFQLTSATDKPVFTIWDAGGTNTLDLSGFSVAQRISLLPGSFSDVNGLTGNVAIAFGTTIQNAVGGSGNDTIIGNDANNVITGRGGNDTIDGGAGTNTSAYVGGSRNYTVTFTSGTSALTVQDKVGSDGTDLLSNIQRAQFTDQTIDTTMLSKTASLATPQLTELVDLYVAYFNRAPDASGLDFWGGALKDGASFATLAASFVSSPEAVAAYPSTLSNGDFVTTVYTNVLGRNTDQGGFNFWVNTLQSRAITKGNFVLNVVESVLGQSGTTDAQYIADKYTVGSHFALTQGLNNGASARTVMSGVNGTAASVTAANAQTDAFAATAATAAGTEFVVKIVGIAA